MKINVNGITREATPDEIAEFEAMLPETPTPMPTPEERIAELEEAMEMLLSGVTE